MGKTSAIVNSVEENKLNCTFRCSGSIFNNSIVHMYFCVFAVNLLIDSLDCDTNEAIELPFKKTLEEYKEDVKIALDLDVEYIIVNGMDSTEGILETRKHLLANNSKIKIFAKIDNKWSISEIDSYIDVFSIKNKILKS